ncbi:hypothetical protein M422DRAFT_247114 [Sphaerobolus stellatus SS14]|nr:hypothetical protein M422DRAFT_247114 [Sphaerobolus stellatus SS14]
MLPVYEVPEAVGVMMLKNVVDKSLVKHVATPLEVTEAYLFVMKCTLLTVQSLLVDGGYVLGA